MGKVASTGRSMTGQRTKPDPRRGYTFSVLNGPTFAETDRPAFWTNDTALVPPQYSPGNPPDMESLPLHTFPLIEDFTIRVETMTDPNGHSLFGYGVRFFSPTLGYLASFPWWDHAEQDLARADFRMPLGSFEAPYCDLEQGWEIVIAERGILVYVLEGRFDQRRVDGYEIWFKVHKTHYIEQWREALLASRQLVEASRKPHGA